MIDPVAAAVDALVAHLTSELGVSARVLRGFPAKNVAMDLDTLPVVSVTAQRATGVQVSPRVVDSVSVDAVVSTYTYIVAELAIPVQIDLFAQYRAQRDDLGYTIGQLLNPLASLWLTSATYHGRSIAVDVGQQFSDDDGDTATRGEWRIGWVGNLRTDLVAQTTHPRLAVATLRLTTDLSGVELTTAT